MSYSCKLIFMISFPAVYTVQTANWRKLNSDSSEISILKEDCATLSQIMDILNFSKNWEMK